MQRGRVAGYEGVRVAEYEGVRVAEYEGRGFPLVEGSMLLAGLVASPLELML